MWLTQREVVFIFLRAKISDSVCNDLKKNIYIYYSFDTNALCSADHIAFQSILHFIACFYLSFNIEKYQIKGTNFTKYVCMLCFCDSKSAVSLATC